MNEGDGAVLYRVDDADVAQPLAVRVAEEDQVARTRIVAQRARRPGAPADVRHAVLAGSFGRAQVDAFLTIDGRDESRAIVPPRGRAVADEAVRALRDLRPETCSQQEWKHPPAKMLTGVPGRDSRAAGRGAGKQACARPNTLILAGAGSRFWLSRPCAVPCPSSPACRRGAALLPSWACSPSRPTRSRRERRPEPRARARSTFRALSRNVESGAHARTGPAAWRSLRPRRSAPRRPCPRGRAALPA